MLEALFTGIVPSAVQLVRKQLTETVPTCNHNLVTSCFNLLDSLIKPYLGQEGEQLRRLLAQAGHIITWVPCMHNCAVLCGGPPVAITVVAATACMDP